MSDDVPHASPPSYTRGCISTSGTRKLTNFGAFTQEAANDVGVVTADGTVQRSHATDVFMLDIGTAIHQTLHLNTNQPRPVYSLNVSHVNTSRCIRCIRRLRGVIVYSDHAIAAYFAYFAKMRISHILPHIMAVSKFRIFIYAFRIFIYA